MKKVIFMLLAVIAFCGCAGTTNESTAKQLIKERLKLNLHDYSSYESVEFGSLDSTFTTLLTDSAFFKAFTRRLAYQKARNESYENAELWKSVSRERQKQYLGLEKQYQDSVTRYIAFEDSARNKFIPVFNGFAMRHSFRANNANGNKVITHNVYKFNTELSVITETEEADDYYGYNVEEVLEGIKKEFLGTK